MKLAGVRLDATTILETVVASSVLLIVFVLAMESAVRINRIGRSEWDVVEVAFNECRDSLENVLAASDICPDSCSVNYPWGTMAFVFGQREDFAGLTEVKAVATLKNGRKTVYRYLTERWVE